MSRSAEKYVLSMKSGRLTTKQRLFLLILAIHHQEYRQTFWPSHETLAGEMATDEREVRRMVAELEGLGIIVFNSGRGRGNRGKYEFLELKEETKEGEKEETKEEKTAPPNKVLQDQKLQEQILTTSSSSQNQTSDDDVEQNSSLERASFQRFGAVLPDGKERKYKLREVDRVLDLFNQSPIVAHKAGNADRETAQKLLQDFSLEEIERGILLGTQRRMFSDRNSGVTVKVSSISYFVGAIEEARRDHMMTDSYIDRIRAAIRRESERLGNERKPPQSESA